MKKYQVGQKIKIETDFLKDSVYEIKKIRNYQKGQRLYLRNMNLDYGCMVWGSNPNIKVLLESGV